MIPIRPSRDEPLILKMIADGYTGRKGKGGFYRINKEAGKVKEAIDLAPAPMPRRRSRFHPSAAQKDLRVLIGLSGKVGAYAWAVLGQRWPMPPGWWARRRTTSLPSIRR
jgi:3-hydroxyacyl-CoA dehydrogenase